MENYCFHIATRRQEEEDGKTLGCDKWQGCYLLIFFQSFTKKDLFKRRWSLAEGFFKQNYCHACHTLRFAVFFSLPSCCVRQVHSAYAFSKVKIQFFYGLNDPFCVFFFVVNSIINYKWWWPEHWSSKAVFAIVFLAAVNIITITSKEATKRHTKRIEIHQSQTSVS